VLLLLHGLLNRRPTARLRSTKSTKACFILLLYVVAGLDCTAVRKNVLDTAGGGSDLDLAELKAVPKHPARKKQLKLRYNVWSVCQSPAHADPVQNWQGHSLVQTARG
jgi:hypothetical protein